MKKLFILLSVFIFLPLLLISGNDINTLGEERMELLNNRQYKFFEYSYYDSGFYSIEMDIKVDEYTTLKFETIVHSSGANINKKNRNGMVPLVALSIRTNILDSNHFIEEIALLLLGAGTDVNAENEYGTVLDQTWEPEIRKILINAGAIVPPKIAWQKKFYVDSFGDPTEKPYITNIARIKGVFSNSATAGSELGVYFIIDTMDDIEFKLFEYNGNNPVKSNSTKKYDISVKDEKGNIHKLYGSNSSNRIRLMGCYATTLHGLLSKNGLLKFHVVETDNRIATYDFEVNGRGYESVSNGLMD